jgi:hypothetical protein
MSTNKGIIFVITTTIATMALLCVTSICLLCYWGIQIAPELNTLTGGLVGALTAMLVKTSPTETTHSPDGAPPNGGSNGVAPTVPTPVTVENKPENPVPTSETH